VRFPWTKIRATIAHFQVSRLQMKPARFRYVRAETADQAVELLRAADGTGRILAGGQSLIPALSARSISAGEATPSVSYPWPFSSKRSAFSTSGWSSAIRIRAVGIVISEDGAGLSGRRASILNQM